jgi:hypothetical protein
VTAPADLDDLSPTELNQLVSKLLAENAEQKRQIAELREEIARLKGLKGRPQIRQCRAKLDLKQGRSVNGFYRVGLVSDRGATAIRESFGHVKKVRSRKPHTPWAQLLGPKPEPRFFSELGVSPNGCAPCATEMGGGGYKRATVLAWPPATEHVDTIPAIAPS